jgi:restriction endonuclease S subunit
VYKNNDHFGISSSVGILRPNQSLLVPEFLYYFVSSSFFKQSHAAQDGGSVQGYTNIPSIKRLRIPIPTLTEQKQIVGILRALDDKIELNHQINKILEQMAQTLFKAWFVDFEPAWANMENRSSESSSTEIAKLFPSVFENTLPSGWGYRSLPDFFRLIGGGTPKTTNPEFWNGEIPWYSVVDAPKESDVFVIDTEKKITKLGLEKSSTKLLRKGLTIISARGTVGKLAITGSEMAMNQSCYAIEGNFGDYFTFYLAKRAITELKQNTHGAVFDTITQDTFKSVSAVLPNQAVIDEFEKTVSIMMHKIENNLRENRSLEQIRDSLLPRLISGQLSLQK